MLLHKDFPCRRPRSQQIVDTSDKGVRSVANTRGMARGATSILGHDGIGVFNSDVLFFAGPAP
ncbi:MULTISPECIES: hypothetical protein [Cupriavidus]|jgi:hypothetical protein|uniref:Uncharacterized protein n=1 Tax=Cupriavidus pauculus TaxID=82633 RepID=A0A5P2H4S4_9BURK|nr:hypothetical protein [Cupriavidus pauculus]QET02513.1 hypothetical protein FOB72_10990 [Cupriavidus pauculus]